MQRNFAYIHRDGCGKPAFFMEKEPVAGQAFPRSSEVVFPNGEHPEPGTVCKCGSCGRDLFALSVRPGFRLENVEAVYG